MTKIFLWLTALAACGGPPSVAPPSELIASAPSATSSTNGHVDSPPVASVRSEIASNEGDPSDRFYPRCERRVSR